jgi:hypothetical protein
LYGNISRFLYRLHGEIPCRLHHDTTLAANPRNNGRPIFVVVAPAGLTLLAVPSGAGLTLSFRPLWLGPCSRRCDRGRPLPRSPPIGGASHRTGRHSAATSTTDNRYGYAPPPHGRCAGMSTTGTTER